MKNDETFEGIDRDKLIGLLDKFIDRSERWQKDAVDRGDDYDMFFYKGQKDMVEEIKGMVKKL
ncbi:hypothetical protein FKN04_22810 [Bacillus glycinifermentans]|uniref:hypothetical protein n=1 Tax=Bacillus TaxID=1386 RepID=UPI0015826B60|nr:MULTISPECIES: hypothetical protein [Bacillus]NUJ19366.1 hypothetical protein [Bacillus glycinifermentans]GIN67101.1 hypothetical protein J41TS2_25220 [Bacillus sonorensis]